MRFAKVDTEGRYPTLRGESERMVWAAAYLPVPTVVALEQQGGTTILLTEALPGRDATDEVWRDDLGALVAALGRGLRAFHEAVGEEWCPFRFDIERALEHVRRRVATDDIDPAGFHEDHRHLSPAAALAELEATAPADEDLVVCHGDYCPPNVLLRDGAVTGYVDLGELGAADRWWDVATGGWSTCWNFGERVRAALLRELRHHARPGAHPLLPAALRPGVLTGTAAGPRPARSAGAPGGTPRRTSARSASR